jgi:signal transduction histidine kinase
MSFFMLNKINQFELLPQNPVRSQIKYTETGEIGIEVATSGDNFRVTVRDTGPGIARPDQHRIFESFEQAHASESQVRSGAGLGLAICKTIVEMHGGSIGVASDLGRGSLFWCTFPIRVDQ